MGTQTAHEQCFKWEKKRIDAMKEHFGFVLVLGFNGDKEIRGRKRILTRIEDQ